MHGDLSPEPIREAVVGADFAVSFSEVLLYSRLKFCGAMFLQL